MTNAADLIRAVARIHGLPDGPLSEPGWPGVVNEVNIVGSGTDRYVIRIPRGRGRTEEFAVEAWCAERAREHAVPTADVVGVGVVNAVAYCVQRFVAGASGETVRSAELWRTLGRYARIINAIPLDDAPDALFSRFGRDLPAAWRAHLDYNIDSLDDADPLIELGVYDRAVQSRVRAVVESLRYHSFEFGLSHGDLALRNLLVDPGRPPVLIDWGSASTGPVPHTDLLNLLRNHEELDNPRDDELTFFSQGYGVDLDALRPQLDAMQTLSAIDLVRWARDHRPDLLDQTIATARERVTAPAALRPTPSRHLLAGGPIDERLLRRRVAPSWTPTNGEHDGSAPGEHDGWGRDRQGVGMDLFGVHRRRVAELGAWAAERAIHITKYYRIISQTEH